MRPKETNRERRVDTFRKAIHENSAQRLWGDRPHNRSSLPLFQSTLCAPSSPRSRSPRDSGCRPIDPVALPAMEGEVKAHTSPAPEMALISGVRSQSRHLGPGHMHHTHVDCDGAACADVWPLVLRSSCLVRNPAVFEAALFSRKKCGNHPAIGASECHGFVRFSRGA